MIVDAPGAEEEDTKPGTTEVVLTEENAGEVLDLINKLNLSLIHISEPTRRS